jgi:hypothetical protein
MKVKVAVLVVLALMAGLFLYETADLPAEKTQQAERTMDECRTFSHYRLGTGGSGAGDAPLWWLKLNQHPH